MALPGNRTITILVHMPTLREVLREVIQEVPGSIRELARAAELTHVALIRARDGKMDLSPEATARVIGVLRNWGEKCSALANRLEAASERPGNSESGARG